MKMLRLPEGATNPAPPNDGASPNEERQQTAGQTNLVLDESHESGH